MNGESKNMYLNQNIIFTSGTDLTNDHCKHLLLK